jgi:hypothetical protein
LVARFSTASARDAAITSPIEGQLAFVTGTKELYFYSSVGAWLGVMPRIIRKTALQSVINSAVTVNDTHLFASVEANSIYSWTLELIVSQSNNAGDSGFQSDWSLPSGGTLVFGIIGPGVSSTVLNATTMQTTGFTTTSTVNVDTVQNLTQRTMLTGVLTTTNSGTFQYKWAQAAAVASVTTTVQANSRLLIHKIG